MGNKSYNCCKNNAPSSPNTLEYEQIRRKPIKHNAENKLLTEKVNDLSQKFDAMQNQISHILQILKESNTQATEKEIKQLLTNDQKMQSEMDQKSPEPTDEKQESNIQTTSIPNDAPTITIECSGDDVSECGHLQRLKSEMKTNNNVDIQVAVEDLFHLMNTHKTDDEFDFIYNELGGECNDMSCDMFRRNHRDRNKLENTDELNKLYNCNPTIKISTQQIIDKIHCHYVHCYNIGNKLPLKIQTEIANIDEKKDDYEDYKDENFDYFINPKVKKYLDINAKKYTKYRDIRRLNECNKFMMNPIQYDEVETKELESNLYSFGFKYVYQQNQHDRNKEKNPTYIGFVQKKYKNFKEELISNKIKTISVGQFNNETEKATMYFNKYYKSYFDEHWCNRNQAMFGKHHILAVLIYCNFDKLQYEFSKTYRKTFKNESKAEIRKRHKHFYHLASYLSELIHHVGAQGEKKIFYHGISSDLIFTDPRKACILSPLSSTPSISVAMNFASPNGIIIQFKSNDRCFACAPVSDYSNEDEYLFLQSGYNLIITNVIAIETGTEYRQILNVVGLIEEGYSSNYVPKHVQKIHDRLIKHELFTYGKLTEFTAWKHVDAYAEKLMHQYCIRKTSLNIHIPQLYSNALFIGDKSWIKLNIFNTLFPNLNVVKISSKPIIRLTKNIMDIIFKHVETFTNGKLEKIRITVSQLGYNAESAINEFSSRFEKIGFMMVVSESFDFNVQKQQDFQRAQILQQQSFQRFGGNRFGGNFGGNFGASFSARPAFVDRTKNYDVIQISKLNCMK